MTAAVTAPELVHKLVLGCTHFGGEGIERPAPGFQAAFSVEDAKRMGLQVRCKVYLRQLFYFIVRAPCSTRGHAVCGSEVHGAPHGVQLHCQVGGG